MIADIFTKNSHYRADDMANTVECIGPVAFPPHKVDNVTLSLGKIVAGRRMLVTWADGRGPFGKHTMVTSVVERVTWSRSNEVPLDPKVAAAANVLGIPREEAVKIVFVASLPDDEIEKRLASVQKQHTT